MNRKMLTNILIIAIIITILLLSIYIAIKQINAKNNDIYIQQEDIDRKQKEIEEMSNFNSKYENKVAVQEIVKENIELKEANKANIEITDNEQLEKFRTIAEQQYETSNTTVNKDEFIDEAVNELVNIQKRNLYYADIVMKISTKTFECDDEKVMSEVEKFYNNPSTEQLEKAYNEYINYLVGSYNIIY